jgi:hypothetical protein
VRAKGGEQRGIGHVPIEVRRREGGSTQETTEGASELEGGGGGETEGGERGEGR